ncbi:hypothetical protein [Actibacterium sp. 188UL27-1]|uniref:hypothetical protein n=1 Tax=Actibacterium sp. 188UL27-1 TaxID=2786961 RepID=UPI001957DD63|nr:hypothetical protein [Actibacterium sp. 188UL27-1]MBM7067776.1 hypothetical protein [Actibacterium sp. 188UL27-1]
MTAVVKMLRADIATLGADVLATAVNRFLPGGDCGTGKRCHGVAYPAIPTRAVHRRGRGLGRTARDLPNWLNRVDLS